MCAVADNSFYNSSHCLLTWRAWMCTSLFRCPFLHREIKWHYFIIFFFPPRYKMALFYYFWFFPSLFGPDANLSCQLRNPCELTMQSKLNCNTWRKAKTTRKPWNPCTLGKCQLRRCIFKSPRYASSCQSLAEHLARPCAIPGQCGTSQDLNCLVRFVQLVKALSWI